MLNNIIYNTPDLRKPNITAQRELDLIEQMETSARRRRFPKRTLIEVDSRGCGAGKTTTNIYPRIRSSTLAGEVTLVVVPSKKLQDQYLNDLTKYAIKTHIINADMTMVNVMTTETANMTVSEGSVIEENQPGLSAKAQLKIALEQFEANPASHGYEVIVLTHAAFLMSDISDDHKAKLNLIIDEAFSPVNGAQIDLYNPNKPDIQALNLSRHFRWTDRTTANIELIRDKKQSMPEYTNKAMSEVLMEMSDSKTAAFFELECVNQKTGTPMIDDSTEWQIITRPNSRLWATWAAGESLMNNATSTTHIVVTADANLMRGWKSVMIAAAAFEHTLMSHWIEMMADVDVVTDQAHQFVPHVVPVTIHTPVDKGFRWSKSKRNKNRAALPAFVEYVKQHKSSGSILFVKNGDDKSSGFGPVGLQISHNAHGMNQYSHITNYAHLTAQQPTPALRNYLKNSWGMTESQIAMGFSGVDTYQLIMRTKLRLQNNTDRVNVFLIDGATAFGKDNDGVTSFFSTGSDRQPLLIVKPDIDLSIAAPEARKNASTVSRAERQRQYRARQAAHSANSPVIVPVDGIRGGAR